MGMMTRYIPYVYDASVVCMYVCKQCRVIIQRGTFSLTTVRSVILDDFGVGYFGGHTFMREKHLLLQ